VAVANLDRRRCWLAMTVTIAPTRPWPAAYTPARNVPNRGAQRQITLVSAARDRAANCAVGRRNVAPVDSAHRNRGRRLRHADVCHRKEFAASSCT